MNDCDSCYSLLRGRVEGPLPYSTLWRSSVVQVSLPRRVKLGQLDWFCWFYAYFPSFGINRGCLTMCPHCPDMWQKKNNKETIQQSFEQKNKSKMCSQLCRDKDKVLRTIKAVCTLESLTQKSTELSFTQRRKECCDSLTISFYSASLSLMSNRCHFISKLFWSDPPSLDWGSLWTYIRAEDTWLLCGEVDGQLQAHSDARCTAVDSQSLPPSPAGFTDPLPWYHFWKLLLFFCYLQLL